MPPNSKQLPFWTVFVVALCLSQPAICVDPAPDAASPAAPPSTILVVGSLNVDIIIPVHRLPQRGETITARIPSTEIAVGGKGANQAVAAARLSAGTGKRTSFVCRFGNDAYADMLEAALVEAGVDVSGCGRAAHLPSGQGIVQLEVDGTASSIVIGGANTDWAKDLSTKHLLRDAGVVMLQREVPEDVNLAVAEAAVAAGVPVLLDVGGEDRPITDKMLRLVDYLAPNESELQRLTGMPTSNEEQVIAAATSLIKRGARNVLITLAERGSLLVKSDGTLVRQEALPVPGGTIVDGTAAGDAFRAAFAVALVERWALQQCLQFASAAGAIAVSRMGAVPSLPTRQEVLALLPPEIQARVVQTKTTTTTDHPSILDAPSTDTAQESCAMPMPTSPPPSAPTIKNLGSTTVLPSSRAPYLPYKFASRLNSMQARRDLISPGRKKVEGTNDVYGWIARQGQIQGLDLVDFNYPQHFVNKGITLKKLNAALDAAGLQTGAVCIRFPEEFYSGGFSNPDPKLRAKAVEIAKEGCRWAADLGARDLIVWSPYDGYDYHLQVNYQAAWKWTVESFQQLADSCPPGVRVSLEFKPTDEATRFSIVPSTGAALLLTRDVNRPNFGLTLDVGHLLMAGENPAQSVAMVGAAGKLFGMQLNDAHVKLGAEDGLAFGAINPTMALELVHWLRKVNYNGHIYYDTFPRKEDPVREAEYNIRKFKTFWARAERLAAAGLDNYLNAHDAMGVLELLEADEAKV